MINPILDFIEWTKMPPWKTEKKSSPYMSLPATLTDLALKAPYFVPFNPNLVLI